MGAMARLPLRPRFALAAVAIAVALLLASCGGGGNGGEEATPSGPITVTVWHSMSSLTQAVLQRMADEQKSYAVAAEGHEAAEGDALLIDFNGTIDGQSFEGGTAEDHQIVLGSGTFLPGFEEQLTGAKSGDHRTVGIDCPRDYPAENLAGKPATFEVDVNEVQEREPVEANEDFDNLVALLIGALCQPNTRAIDVGEKLLAHLFGGHRLLRIAGDAVHGDGLFAILCADG